MYGPHPSDGTSKLLFRGNWLPHYLNGLPGIKVNLKRCETIAASSDEASELSS
jgi:hypothetical protein